MFYSLISPSWQTSTCTAALSLSLFCFAVSFFLPDTFTSFYFGTIGHSLNIFWSIYVFPAYKFGKNIHKLNVIFCICVDLGGLGVTCSPRDPRFSGSNPAEVDGFFQDLKILSTSPPGGTLSWGSRAWDFWLVKEPQA